MTNNNFPDIQKPISIPNSAVILAALDYFEDIYDLLFCLNLPKL
jgi:hypothetical protein